MADGKSAVMARQLDAAQAITHVGSWEWDLASGVVTWSDELYRIYGLEPRSRTITLDVFMAALLPVDRTRIQGEIQAALGRGGRFAYRERIVRPDGSVRVLDTIGEVVQDDAGKPTGLLGTCRDVTEEAQLAEQRHRDARVQAGERRALELLASGATLNEVLACIVTFIEEVSGETIASVLLLDGDRLRHGAAPNLPEAYNRAIDGAQIGPQAGSCGTAAFRGEPVYVEDIMTDPLWADYRQLIAPYGLRACWSTPIRSADGHVLGTFAVYYREPKSPDAAARELIARAAHVAGIAIERRLLDDRLRALSERIDAAREDERTHIAREIHDELGQALTALKLDLAWVTHRSQGEVRGRVIDMAAATDALIDTVRRISSELRPGILDEIGLLAAIEWQGDEFSRRTQVPCVVRAEVGDLQLERNLATAVFRIFQEALTNITRHANATRVDVALRLERGHLRLEVADDGVGVPEISPRNSSLGLLGMRERARRCGGDCTVRRREPRGTIVSLSVPLRFPSERDAEIGA
jgi:PAS domain S-box-containing protein